MCAGQPHFNPTGRPVGCCTGKCIKGQSYCKTKYLKDAMVMFEEDNVFGSLSSLENSDATHCQKVFEDNNIKVCACVHVCVRGM